MKNEYKIGEVAEYFGISRDTLRHYDRLGILSPPQNNENGYRIYSRADFLCMAYIRDLREAGVSLKDIALLMREGSIEKAEAIMQVRQAQIDEKISELEYMYGVIEDYKLSYRNIIGALGEPKIIKSPQFIFLEITDDVKTLMAASKAFKRLDRLAVPRLTFVHEMEYLFDPNYESLFLVEEMRDKMLKWALSLVDDKNYTKRRAFGDFPFKIIRSCLSLHAFIETEANNDYSGINKLIEYIDKADYAISGDPIFRAVAFRNLSKQETDYYEVWIPVKNK